MNAQTPAPHPQPAWLNGLFLPTAYPHAITSVRLIETHISWVFLTGEYAYKIKKPVDFGFLDFSTLEKRQFYCAEEIRLNRRLAQDWYLRTVPIAGSIDRPQINGPGEPFEYAVMMRQFPSAQTLKDYASQDSLAVNEIDQIADMVAGFHGSISSADAHSPYGESTGIKRWADENFHHIKPLLNAPEQLMQIEAIEQWSNQEWAGLSDVMRQRKRQGFVRECHGDLHLGNMSLIDGRVMLFDCIEFNPMLRWIDVISEAAFLVMDLMHLGYKAYAYRFLNHYLQQTGDYAGLTLLRYYLVYRAMVRAKVALLRITQQPDSEICKHIRSEYAAYTGLVEKITAPDKPPVLIITHGFSGSGKSTYTSQLAEIFGAIQLRSDLERKRLFGYEADTATHSGIDTGIYSAEAGEKVYRYLLELGNTVLLAGFSVIIDATFLKNRHREMFRQLAVSHKIKFIILDFEAAENTLIERIRTRQNDPSEATVEVFKQQLQTSQPLTQEELHHTIPVNTETGDVLRPLLSAFGTRS